MFSLGSRTARKRNRRTSEASASTLRRHRPDYVLLIISTVLLLLGLIVVYSISPGLAAARNVSEGYYVTKQLIAITLGFVAFAVFSLLPLAHLKRLSKALIALSFIMIIAAQVFGEEINGAHRWIQVGGLSFQVAELIKFTLIVWLASFLVERVQRGEMANTNKTLKPLLVVMGLIGFFVASPALQSDLGSSAVMLAIIGIMAFSTGLPLKKIMMIGAVVAAGIVLAVSTSSYRRDRVETFLNPASDCQASGYQSCQALIALGSGGVFGLGLGKSVQAYGYLPEAANDSIFAIVGEKFGFFGGTVIIGMYVALFARMRRIILRTADLFSRLFVIGVLVWLSTQAMINIGAMIGLLPLKGITLPFISYGGTSLVFIMAALGVVFQISRYTSFAPIRDVKVASIRETHDDHRPGRRGQRRPYYATASSR